MQVVNRTLPVAVSTAAIDDATGSIAAVAAVTGQKIIVWGLILTAPADHTLTFKSDMTALCGPLAATQLLLAAPSSSGPWGSVPWFETAAGEAFNIVADSAVQVSGIVYYTTAAV